MLECMLKLKHLLAKKNRCARRVGKQVCVVLTVIPKCSRENASSFDPDRLEALRIRNAEIMV